MVVPCNNFRSYIKCKQDAYIDGTLTLTHGWPPTSSIC
jgi:hypothetical protein